MLGDEAQNKMQLDTPPEHASVQEWEDWASKREAKTMAKRTKAAEEMRLIAEGRRIIREESEEAAQRMLELAKAANQDSV